MTACIYDKTEKGREEIATRKYRVTPRLRTLLVMVDGRQPLETLLKGLAGLGVNQDCVDELLAQEYIHEVAAAAPEVVPQAERLQAEVRAGMPQRTRAAAFDVAESGREERAPVEREQAAPAAALDLVGEAGTISEAQQVQALHAFFNQTIRSTLGLRGFALQLKVERSANLDELRVLRQPYLEAVFKAKGREMALSLRERLDALLGGKPGEDTFILPE
jgi:hypothetical protein